MKDLTKIKADSQCTHHFWFMGTENMRCANCNLICSSPITIKHIWAAKIWAYWWMLKQKVKLWFAK